MCMSWPRACTRVIGNGYDHGNSNSKQLEAILGKRRYQLALRHQYDPNESSDDELDEDDADVGACIAGWTDCM